MPLIKLCKLDDLEEIDSREFVITELSPARNIFIVRRHSTVFAYENSCPHNLAPLNWLTDVFLTVEKDYIQCVNHGALFNIDDGQCIYGPCVGHSLPILDIQLNQGEIYLSM